MEANTPLRCKCRKQAITSLRCSRCFIPICPECSKVGVVGMLCRDCAKGHRTHLTEISPKDMTRGTVAAVLSGIFVGWLVVLFSGFGIMGAIWGGLFHGLAVSEACLRASGHKRGLKMEILVGLSCLFGILAGWALVSMGQGGGDRLIMYLLNPASYILLAFSTFIGVMRLRSY